MGKELLKRLESEGEDFVRALKRKNAEEGLRYLLTELYPDNAHFIFELLQNAEDAKATVVNFILNEDQLTFTHNGSKLFLEQDIIAITNIGSGTKKDDVNSIGKFGVGFKAVFAYTNQPRVYSGEFNFEIKDLYVPHEIDPVEKDDGETVFVFPFNNDDKPKTIAFEEVKKSLNDIDKTTLLFLKSITRININVLNETFNVTKITDEENKISTISNSKLNTPTRFLVFKKQLDYKNDLFVSIAFRLGSSPNSMLDEIKVEDQSRVSIYFPAEKETSNLKFHIHAPFSSTVSRDSITKRPENDQLISLIADLLCEAALWINETDISSNSFLKCLPLDSDNLGEFYKPIQSKIIEFYNNESLLLCEDDNYYPASKCWQSTERLKGVISFNDLRVLLKGEIENDSQWLLEPYKRNAKNRVSSFLKSLKIGVFSEQDFLSKLLSLSNNFVVTPEGLVNELKKWEEVDICDYEHLGTTIKNIILSDLNLENTIAKLYLYLNDNSDSIDYNYELNNFHSDLSDNYNHIIVVQFLSGKKDNWLISLYELIYDIITAKADFDYDDFNIALYSSLSRFIRMENGKFNFQRNKCYFPSQTKIDSMKSLIISRSIYIKRPNKASKSFKLLKNIVGVKSINIDEEVKHVLKLYKNGEVKEHLDIIEHLKLFLKYFKENKTYFDASLFEDVKFLINTENDLSLSKFILIDNPIQDTSLGRLANEKYNTLHPIYFESNSTIDRRLFKDFLKSLNCFFEIPIIETRIPWLKTQKFLFNRKVNENSINKDYTFALDNLFTKPTIWKGLMIWENLAKRKNIEIFTAEYRANASHQVEFIDSSVLECLKENAWIPNNKGVFFKPKDITRDSLNENFIFNDENGWLTAIGLGTGVKNKTEFDKTSVKLKKEFGISLEVLQEAQEKGIDLNNLLLSEINRKTKLNLKDGIDNHNRTVDNKKTQLKVNELKNQKLYRESAQARLYNQISISEERGDSFTFSKKVKIGKDETRLFLKEQYSGLCQI